MIKYIKISLIFIGFIMLACGSAFALTEVMPNSELVDRALEFDGKNVIIAGESIGTALRQNGSCWINVYDGGLAVGVYGPLELIKDITYFGDYNHKGDIIKINGVFNRQCAVHGGDLDVHAVSWVVVGRGYEVEHKLDSSKKKTAVVCLVFALLSGLFAIIRKVK